MLKKIMYQGLLILALLLSQTLQMAAAAEKTDFSRVKIHNWQEVFSDGEGHTISGKIKIIENFPIPQFKRERRIWVYLPPDYEITNKRYPVLYMHDAQNLFDAKMASSEEWQVDESLEKLFAVGKTKGVIVVGIDNSEHRDEEYLPREMLPSSYPGSFAGEKFAQFIVETLKPFIDKTFRTLPGREDTGIAGSSNGAAISLYAGMKYQNVFSKVCALSLRMPPQFEKTIREFIEKHTKKLDMKIYVHVGTRESYADFDVDFETITDEEAENLFRTSMQRSNVSLKNAGFSDKEIITIAGEGDFHNEFTWQKRFPEAVLWLYN